ncbi:integrator complex subunit 14 [Nasonia vitripennis]|uniref:Integrator complex subunit 14 n=1 Tax=Nasonia vitripennis TaxID=7425 RepID=A0A7M7G566_NASVI|nr:integrator complex subunit 14 [Nasonia vitripennis]XP_016840081.1 integrator complex subunit 14 [Nasonia vitripennis]
MPTVIALDVSLSMRRPVVGSNVGEGLQSEQLTRHHLAVQGINTILQYLQTHSKLEFVSLIVFSSLYEVVSPFTRDYDAIRTKLQNIEECDKTCIETVLHGVNTNVISEWGSTTACQVILITDGNPGVGPMSLGDSLNSTNFSRENPFPLPFPYPGKLTLVCLANQSDPSFINALPLYQRLADLAGNDSMVLVPEGSLSKTSVANCFKKLAETNYVSFQGYLKCGHLGSRILLSPPPTPYNKTADFEVAMGLTISKTIEICGFISVADVSSPTSVSRHLVLPLPTEKTQSMQGVSLEEDSDIEEITDEGKTPSFCVLLHGALKVENMAALCMLNTDWYGFIYSWADTKKKSNLMLTVLEHGTDAVPWLGNLKNLGPMDLVSSKMENPPFPVRPAEKRSYSQNAPSWIRVVGLQSDIQKILRHARKLPEKTQNFYKELNRLRRAALSLGFVELLTQMAIVFDRECTVLSNSFHPDCSIQMGHVADELRKPYSRELKNNIAPLKTKFTLGEQ